MTQTIEQLQARVRELEAENARLCGSHERSVSLRQKLAAAQSRVAELEAANARLKAMEESALKVCGQLDDIVMVMPYDYLDPPDGGNVPMHEQIKRMYSEVKVLRNNVAIADELHQQLLIAQAEIKRMRYALEYHQEQTRPIERTVEALAQPSDTSALDAYVAEKVNEAMK